MATLHIRNVPQATRRLLERLAKENGRSMNSEAIFAIERGLQSDYQDQAELWREIRAGARGLKGDVDVVGLIREDRDA